VLKSKLVAWLTMGGFTSRSPFPHETRRDMEADEVRYDDEISYKVIRYDDGAW